MKNTLSTLLLSVVLVPHALLAASQIDVPAGASQADIVQALADVDDGGTVVLLGSEYTLSSALALSRGVTLKGQGRTATVLKGDANKHRGVEITNDDAVLCDLTVSGFTSATASGAGIYMTKGTVRNCRVTGNKNTAANSKGAGVYMATGRLVNVVIDSNTVWGQSGTQGGGGLYMADGWVEGCLITGNNICWDYICFGGITPGYYGGGVYVANGTIVNTTISGNKTYGRGGGVYVDGTTARLYSCIVSGNDCDMRQESVELEVAPASATNYLANCIIGGAAADQYPGIGGWCGLDADYKPTVHSSGVGQGDATLAFLSANDLAGNPRIHDGVADIGCYAYAASLAKCGIGADRQRALVGQTVTLTALVHAATAPASCSWSVTAPDATVIPLSGRSPTLKLSQVGTYALSLTADGATSSQTDWLKSLPLTNTVLKSQSIHDAVAAAADGQVILLPDDDYKITSPVRVRSDIHVLGDGYTNTTVRNTSSGNIKRVFDIDSPGAVVEGLTMSGGRFKASDSNYSCGLGARIGSQGGTIAFCCIRDGSSGASYAYGGGVALRGAKAVLRNSIVRDNAGATVGGGVYVEDGLVESCLIYGNTMKSGGARVGGGLAFASSKGIVRNTTIVKNSAVASTGSTGGGVYLGGKAGLDQVVNCILLGNTVSTADAAGGSDWAMNRDVKIAQLDPATIFSHCAFDGSLTAYGSGSVSVETSGFVDFANNDLHLVGATCVEKGVSYEGIAAKRDLDGNPRLFGDLPDIGCYESVSAKFEPTFTVSPKKVSWGSSVSLTPDMTGAPAGNLLCRWIFECDGGVTFTNESAGAAAHVATLATGGLYDITLEVFDADSGKSVSSPFVIREAAVACVQTNYVTSAVTTAHPQSPFDRPETASTNLNEVLAKYVMDGSTVILDAGSHLIRSTLKISESVTLSGAGKETTWLVQSSGYDKLTRCLIVDHEDAVVEKLAVVGAKITSDPSIYNRAGAIMLVDLAGGTIRECMVSNVVCGTINQYGMAMACASSKGLISRCLVVDNHSDLMVHVGMCGLLYASAGRVEDCLVVGNSTDGVAGLYAAGTGEFWNCTVTGNLSTNRNGYVDAAGLGVASENCKVVNCVFSGNFGVSSVPKYSPEAMAFQSSQFPKGAAVLTDTNVVRNCLFTFADPDQTIGYRCLNDDPKFVDVANADYRLAKDSPCRWAGQRGAWMSNALDYYGNPRCYGRGHPDIGCQQQNPKGFVLLVR